MYSYLCIYFHMYKRRSCGWRQIWVIIGNKGRYHLNKQQWCLKYGIHSNNYNNNNTLFGFCGSMKNLDQPWNLSIVQNILYRGKRLFFMLRKKEGSFTKNSLKGSLRNPKDGIAVKPWFLRVPVQAYVCGHMKIFVHITLIHLEINIKNKWVWNSVISC